MSSGEPDDEQPVHPQLRQAIELVSRSVPGHITFASVARAVALSPDYLGRLCKQQTGVSFFGHNPMGAAADQLAIPRQRRVSHRRRPPGGICRWFARQPGVPGNDRGTSERLGAGAQRFAVSLTAGRLTGGDRESDGSVQATATRSLHA